MLRIIILVFYAIMVDYKQLHTPRLSYFLLTALRFLFRMYSGVPLLRILTCIEV